MRCGRRESVFEAHHRLLGQHRIGHGEGGLAGGQMLQGDEATPRGLVVQHRMSMEEGASAAILAGQPHRIALLNQAGIGEIFGAAPIEREVARHHALARPHDGQHARMEIPVRRIRGDRFSERFQAGHVDRGLDGLGPIRAHVLAPVDRVLIADEAECGTRLRPALVQPIAVLIHHRRRFSGGQYALRREFFRINLTHRGFLANRLVHQGLGRGRLVGFVMTVPAVAHQIDDDVFVELHPVFEGEAHDKAHRLRIIRIDVENRRFHHLRHIGTIQRRTRVARIAGGEAHLVVDDDVDGAAGAEAARLRQLQRLHDDALTRKRRVPVNLHRQHLVTRRIAAAFLPRTRRSFDDWVDDLEMRRVERQGNVDIARHRFEVRRESLVILDVTRAAQIGEVVVTLEFVEQVLGRFSEQIHQHVQPAAMCHADDGLLDAGLAALLHQIVEQRYEAVAALERKALLTDVLGVQIAFESLRRSQLPQNVFLLFDRKASPHPRRLKIILQPEAFVAVRNVRKLCADGVAIDKLQGAQDFLELAALRDSVITAIGEELRIQVSIRQSEVVQIEHVRPRPFLQSQRIEIGDQVTTIRIDLNQAGHGTLFGAGDVRCSGRDGPRPILLAVGYVVADIAVRYLMSRTAPKPAEVFSPTRRNRRRILQKLLVEILDETGISAGQSRSGQLVCK